MEDIERAFDDSICTFRNLIKDNRFLPGAAATEIYLAEKLEEEG
jgi:chaperonin GroEL (HSP60 family)